MKKFLIECLMATMFIISAIYFKDRFIDEIVDKIKKS